MTPPPTVTSRRRTWADRVVESCWGFGVLVYGIALYLGIVLLVLAFTRWGL